MLSSPLLYTIISFTITMIAIYKLKPKYIFNGNRLKEFGMGYNKSLLPFPVMAILIAIITYFIFFYIDYVNSKTSVYVNQLANTTNMPYNNIIPMSNIPEIQNQSPSKQYIYRVIKQTPDGRIFI